jgi:N-acetylglucosamine kinase-like BadF-type ATPase
LYFLETSKNIWLNVVNLKVFRNFAAIYIDYMLLVADSGSTKTDWILTGGKAETTFQTEGLNPYFVGQDEICAAIVSQPEMVAAQPDCVFFYGAGCSSAKIPLVENALKICFPNADIAVADDMRGAAIALFADSQGIACILGTGANSCYFNGQRIVSQIPPLGYVLGDEGSGTDIGRRLLRLVLRRQLPAKLINNFYGHFGLSSEQILASVYSKPCPNRFIANFSTFVSSNIEEPEIGQIVENSFSDFARNLLLHYEQSRQLTVGFTGSIAHVYQTILRSVLQRNGLQIGEVIKSPLRALAKFHYHGLTNYK